MYNQPPEPLLEACINTRTSRISGHDATKSRRLAIIAEGYSYLGVEANQFGNGEIYFF
jgi:hypothetical protein